MPCYQELSHAALSELYKSLLGEYQAKQALHLKLDMSRGRPEAAQLDLANDMLTVLPDDERPAAENGLDCRNYGGLEGIPEARRLFADMLEVRPEEVIVGGNSSLSLMYDAVMRAMLLGVDGKNAPWCRQGAVKFLAPSPGYDRHFAICESLGIELVTIAMTPDGPDMDAVEQWVNNDPAVKGIWCVPKYSNPQGITYSDETVRRFAALRPAAPDFRIFWDNAYCVHDLTDEGDRLLNIMDACRAAGNEDMVYIFGSTSKISFAGAGIAVMAASAANVRYIARCLSMQTIGFDKVNQLRHVRYFRDMNGIRARMKKQASFLKPKFEMLSQMFAPLAADGILRFQIPNGGYFISVDTLDGCAGRVVQLCREAGVVLTSAGATYPYGKDPHDSNIRIAPTCPPLAELRQAAELFCLCVRLASAEKLLQA